MSKKMLSFYVSFLLLYNFYNFSTKSVLYKKINMRNPASGNASCETFVVRESLQNKGTFTQIGKTTFNGTVVFNRDVVFSRDCKFMKDVNLKAPDAKTLEKNPESAQTSKDDYTPVPMTIGFPLDYKSGNYSVYNIFVGSEAKILEGSGCNCLMCFPFNIEIYGFSLIGDSSSLNWKSGDCKFLILNRSQIELCKIDEGSVFSYTIKYDQKDNLWPTAGKLGRATALNIDKTIEIGKGQVISCCFISGNFEEPTTVTVVLFWQEKI